MVHFKSQDDLKLKASDFTVEDNYNYGVLIFPENLSLTDNNKKLESLIKLYYLQVNDINILILKFDLNR